jgi:uncharacterized protein (TIGR02687 family)
MKLNQLQDGLLKAFNQENHRIVFWYDPAQDFLEELGSLQLDGVQTVNMQDESALGIKLKLELEDTQGKYLLYFPQAEPEIEKDWLLDIKLYSRCFYADRISIIFNDLGLQQQSVRAHLAKRDAFLGSKARIKALQRWIQPDADETALDLAMITALVKAENCDIAHILFALAEQMASAGQGLEENPAVLDELAKYQLLPALVDALQAEVGYPATTQELNGEQQFNFGNFLIRLLTTGFCEGIADIPDWASGLAIPSANARATSRALLSRWRDSSRYYQTFDVVSGWVAEALRIEQKLKGISLEELEPVETFEAVEKQIVIELAAAVPVSPVTNLNRFSDLIRSRLDSYWATRHKDDTTRRKYRTIYTALSAAIDLFRLQKSHDSGFHFTSTEALYKAYETDLYKFDTAYRHYFEASQRAHVELLKPLNTAVESCYSNWYLDTLAKNWGDKLEGESRLADWQIPDVVNQYQFYQTHVAPVLAKAKNKRLVVIISDAFRYEAAVELKERINEKRYSEASLKSQLGVLPSYTTLGMASLLPHETLEYREGNGDDVFVDGQSTKGLPNRNKVLAAHGGMAVSAVDMSRWSRDEGREALKDQQLVYVYHNIIDDRSDSGGPSEADTFKHVEDAIEDLTELTRKIMMHFNTSTVIVTADHGFLFQQSKLVEADRTALTEKPLNPLKSKKRYVIGHGMGAAKDAWCGSTQQAAGTSSDTEFWIPKGINRFHFVGGARFVHGGAMPQEVVVPIVTVNQLRGAKAEKRTKRKVGVISASSGLKMVANIQKFDFMQTEAVTEQVQPVTVAIAIYEGSDKVSSEEVTTFDSATDSVADRVKKISLSLAGSNFDRNKDYALVIKDKDLNTEIERYAITIDLAFTDDFF